jgi:hypothetical protein
MTDLREETGRQAQNLPPLSLQSHSLGSAPTVKILAGTDEKPSRELEIFRHALRVHVPEVVNQLLQIKVLHLSKVVSEVWRYEVKTG